MLDGLIDLVVTGIGRPMLNAAVLFIAFLLLALRANLLVVAGVAAGGFVFANYQTIAGYFGF
jgi:hypothetical protein